jgi:hypothetical protein
MQIRIVNIQIIRVFTKVREILMDNLSIRLEIEQINKTLLNHDKNIELVFSYTLSLTNILYKISIINKIIICNRLHLLIRGGS